MTDKLKSNYVSEKEIETFIFSNLLHAIDNFYIKQDIEDIKVVVDKVENKEKPSYEIYVTSKKKSELVKDLFVMPLEADTKCDQLRSMMGLTMQVLDKVSANGAEENILRIVK